MQISSVLILTHRNSMGIPLLPHYEWLVKYNADLDIHIIIGEDSLYGKEYNWKNGDMPLRKWWKNNKEKVIGQGILVIEWDALVACKIPELPDELDLASKWYFEEPFEDRYNWKKKSMTDPSWTPNNWWWWPEIPKLKLKEDQRAVGLVSLGCFFLKRWVLDAVCKEEWDHLYEDSIISEMRFPTIASIEGAKIGEIPLPNVSYKEVEIGKYEGIYHGIKKPYNGTFIKK